MGIIPATPMIVAESAHGVRGRGRRHNMMGQFSQPALWFYTRSGEMGPAAAITHHMSNYKQSAFHINQKIESVGSRHAEGPSIKEAPCKGQAKTPVPRNHPFDLSRGSRIINFAPRPGLDSTNPIAALLPLVTTPAKTPTVPNLPGGCPSLSRIRWKPLGAIGGSPTILRIFSCPYGNVVVNTFPLSHSPFVPTVRGRKVDQRLFAGPRQVTVLAKRRFG